MRGAQRVATALPLTSAPAQHAAIAAPSAAETSVAIRVIKADWLEIVMPKLTFKRTRAAHGKTVQLVRYIYCPDAKRSKSVPAGSVRLDADPDALPYGIRLADGQVLVDADIAQIRTWLAEHGDLEAARVRAESAHRIELRVRASLSVAGGAREPGAALTRAEEQLQTATEALKSLAQEARARGEKPWGALRGSYLAIYRAWSRFAAAAQAAGAAKTARRGKAHPDAEDSTSQRLQDQPHIG